MELPAGAAMMAALKARRKFPELNRIGVVLTGGNVDLDRAARIIIDSNREKRQG